MSIFTPIELVWRDETAKIPPNRVLGAIACVEEHVTLTELATEAQAGRLRMVRLARAYGSVLRYAGITVTDDDVYGELYMGDTAQVRERLIASINTLMALMIPPGAVPVGNGQAPAKDKFAGAEKPSKAYIKRSSVRAGSGGKTFGKPIR